MPGAFDNPSFPQYTLLSDVYRSKVSLDARQALFFGIIVSLVKGLTIGYARFGLCSGERGLENGINFQGPLVH